MRLALLLLFSLPLLAQGRFYMLGAVATPNAHPVVTGMAAVAIPFDKAEQNWSYTSYDVTAHLVNSIFTYQTSIRTGFATQVKTIGPIRIFALVDGGYAQVENTAGGAVGGGFVAVCPLGKNWKLVPAYRILKTSVAPGSPKSFVLAVGRTF